jgi:hypothetical protein
MWVQIPLPAQKKTESTLRIGNSSSGLRPQAHNLDILSSNLRFPTISTKLR